MRYLLDTNIISNILKQQPSAPLAAWMAEQWRALARSNEENEATETARRPEKIRNFRLR